MRRYERIFSAVFVVILLIASVYTEIIQPKATQPQLAYSQLFAQSQTTQPEVTQYHNTQQASEDYEDDLIRLHVIANSDSPKDQALKLQVRDRLLLTFGENFREAQSMEDARATIQENLPELEKIALAEIKSQGYPYQVKAQLDIYPFPTRVYGDAVYPTGDYEALRLVIGEGKGANWWCVMFPPLCFVDVSSGTAEQPVDSSYEMEQDCPVSDDQSNVVYTFKAVELWKSFRNWVTNLFS